MRTQTKIALLAAVILVSIMALNQTATAPSTSGPEYTRDGQLKLPEGYREWVYLSTGFDMSYSAASMQMDHHMFDNVFVNPEAYRSFLQTGAWPDKTMMALEVRKAEGKGSINQKGNFQGAERMGLEFHIKDESRFPGKWAFFGFDDSVRPGFSAVRLEVTVTGPESPERYQDLAAAAPSCLPQCGHGVRRAAPSVSKTYDVPTFDDEAITPAASSASHGASEASWKISPPTILFPQPKR